MRKPNRKKRTAKRVLRLPDLDYAIGAGLNRRGLPLGDGSTAGPPIITLTM